MVYILAIYFAKQKQKTKHEKDRYCVQVKWFNLFDCILESNYDKNIEKQNIK